MTAPDQLDPLEEEDKPLDPATEKVRRKMVRLMVVSVGIMMIGLMAVFGAIVYKFTDLGGKKNAPVEAGATPLVIPQSGQLSGEIKLPDGANFRSSSLNGGRILLNIRLSDGSHELWLYDIASNRRFGVIKIN